MTSMFRGPAQSSMNYGELYVDNFAGGGGASTGIELAIGRPVDIAINHDIDAIRMHEVNHPHTRHYCESVWDIDPVKVTEGRPVGLAWFSPDCKHFSKARGGTPVNKNIRGLAWVALRWAATVKPRVIVLENVEEFTTWGPVITGADGSSYPCPNRKGKTFRSFVNALQRQGYDVDHRELRASDYGTPTIRKRLFLIARRDGQPIVWPAPTHGQGLLPHRTAAECIDWSQPCPSIFERRRPLADATLRRIAAGIMRFVVNNPEPFIVKVNHGYDYFRGQQLQEPLQTITSKLGSGLVQPILAPLITEHANASVQRNMPAAAPLRTICAQVKGGHFAVVAPTLVQVGYGERKGQAPRAPGLDKPLGTVVAGGGKHALVAAFLAKHYTGVVGADLRQPTPTVTTVDHNALVTSHLVKLRNNQFGHDIRDPAPTITAGGTHVGEVRAFLVKYYSEGGQWQGLDEPMHTIPTHDRIGLVMVKGEPYQIVDIGMRMLTPRELFKAQGFPDDYVIEHDGHGKAFTKAAQVARCGNSVCPPLAAAIVRANMSEQGIRRAA